MSVDLYTLVHKWSLGVVLQYTNNCYYSIQMEQKFVYSDTQMGLRKPLLFLVFRFLREYIENIENIINNKVNVYTAVYNWRVGYA